MSLTAAKFGGSSLADAEHMRRAADIIRADDARRFVVVSAPGKRSENDTKVTDMLYRCCSLAARQADFEPALAQIKDRFAEIICGLNIKFDLDSEIDAIRTHLSGIPSRDHMASRGEYLNARIFAALLDVPFADTVSLIRFTQDGRFENERTDALLRAGLSSMERAVLPGFYGAADDGTVRTFSRGGSDVTGALVARAVSADLYENWTDVSGMLFTDPRIVENPRTVDYITYRELRELSYMGASVLHEDAVFPVRKAGIPINIRNTNRPDDAGTMIVADLPKGIETHTITGIAGRSGFTSISVEKSMMNNEVGFGAKLFGIFAEHGIPYEHSPTGIDAMSVIVSNALFRTKKEMILQRIRSELQPEFISVESGLAMIAVVGYGMMYAKGCAARIFGAIANAGINIRVIGQGSSEMNIIIGVDEDDYREAIRSIYDEFEKDGQERTAPLTEVY